MVKVHMVRSEPEHRGGPLECDAPEAAVESYRRRGWREAVPKQAEAAAKPAAPPAAAVADEAPVERQAPTGNEPQQPAVRKGKAARKPEKKGAPADGAGQA